MNLVTHLVCCRGIAQLILHMNLFSQLLKKLKFQKNKQVLSDRAVMAFTMANLSPITYGEKTTHQDGIPKLVKSLQDATNINNHNEIRVFDFLFSDDKNVKTDKRYITIPDSKGRSITDGNTWAEILASAIASGAFPIGFPPAIITKYQDEYDSKEWPNNEDIKCESPIPEYLNFAYVDGGTFNNEPIKEAFKLGAFIDFQTNDPKIREIEDRLILFVDPSVPSGSKALQLKSLDPLTEVKNSINKQKADSTKMIDVTIDMVKMVVRQGEVNEEAKIQAFYKSPMLNESLFEYFKTLEVLDINLLLNIIIKNTIDNLESSLNSRHISVGTRYVPEFIFAQYSKLCNATPTKEACLRQGDIMLMYEELVKFVKAKEEILPEHVEANLIKIVVDAGCEAKEVRIFGASVFLAISEMALNQFGKDVKAERAGIFPVNSALKIEALPGYEIAAFAGFASNNARKACFQKGRLDAIVCLESNDFREYHYKTMLKKNILINPIITGKNDLNILKNKHDILFKKLMEELIPEKYVGDLNTNMRPKIVERISYILNNLIIDIKGNAASSNWFSKFWKIFKYLMAVIKEDTKREVDKLLTNEVMSNIILDKKNIAVKIRVQGSVKSVKFNNSIVMNTVEDGQKEDNQEKKSKSFFKIYLVMVDRLQGDECKFSDYCYLSTSNKTNKTIFDNLRIVYNVKDPNKITQVEIGENLIIKSFKFS
ncbi:MAG: hypothetical protein IPL20_06560 [Saprospiraceae bacterium]|nr:hypothetical protein [Saprospiraceae bacterium]